MECSAKPSKSFVMCVGLVCIDNVLTVSTFPDEDSDQPCIDSRRCRGGNASNNSSVLAELGVESTEFLGNLAANPKHDLHFVLDDFQLNKINISHCPLIEDFIWPEATVICSEKTGSRTIIFNGQNLKEISLDFFRENINLCNYGWIHFEARKTTKDLLDFVNSERNKNELKFKISVEIEKTGQGFEALFPLADLVFVSKDFSVHCGAKSPFDAVHILKQKIRKGASLLCTWGDQGAAGFEGEIDQTVESDKVFQSVGIDQTVKSDKLFQSVEIDPTVESDKVFQSVAQNPEKVVDTLGAGDTFTATVIAVKYRYPSVSLKVASDVGCFVAGTKVGKTGFKNLKSSFDQAVKQFVK